MVQNMRDTNDFAAHIHVMIAKREGARAKTRQPTHLCVCYVSRVIAELKQ